MLSGRRAPRIARRIAWLIAPAIALASGCGSGAPGVKRPTVPPLAPVLARPLAAGDVAIYTADAAAAYWYADGRVWRRGWDQAARALADAPAPIEALRVFDRELYVATADSLTAIDLVDHRSRAIGALPPWRAIAIDRDGAWLGTATGLTRIDRATGAVAASVAVGAVTDLATDGDRVYAAVVGGDGVGAIVAVAKRGATVTYLADDLAGAVSLALTAGRLYWSAADGPGLSSVDLATGRRRIDLAGRGRGARAVGERDRVVLYAGATALAEWSGGSAVVGQAVPGHTLAPDSPLVATPTRAVVQLVDSAGAVGLWAVPVPSRSARPAAVVVTSSAPIVAAAIDGPRVVYVASPGAAPDRQTAILFDRAHRTRRTLARGRAIARVAAGAGRIAFIADDRLHVVDRDGRERSFAPPLAHADALTLTATDVWWVDGLRLWRAPLTGTTAAVFHDPSDGSAAIDGYVPAALVVAGAAVFYASLGLPSTGVYRARAGADRTTLAEPGTQRIGGELVQVGAVVVAPLGDADLLVAPLPAGPARALAAPTADETIVDLFGGTRLTAVLSTRAGPALAAIDLRTGARTRRWYAPDELITRDATADDTAVYAMLGAAGWLIAVPR